MTEIIAQIIGIIALGANIICYQMNSRKKILIMQMAASSLWVINLFLQGAFAGVLLNLHAVVRLLFYTHREKHRWMQSNLWILFFCVTAGLCVAVTYQSPVDIIALIGTLATVVSFSLSNPALVRLVTLPSPPCWLIYNIFHGNIGGILNELFVIGSIIVGAIRHDLPAWREKRKNAEE